jgi:hypothetical protein
VAEEERKVLEKGGRVMAENIRIPTDPEGLAAVKAHIVARVEAFLWLHRDHHVTPFGTLDDPKMPQGFHCYACGETLTLTAIFDRLH